MDLMVPGLEFYFKLFEETTSGMIMPSIINFGIAEKLASGPKTVEELAEGTDINTDRLHRLLSQLEFTGQFHFDKDSSKWAHNEVSSYLTDPIVKNYVRMRFSPIILESFTKFKEILCSNKNSMELRNLPPVFEFIKHDLPFLESFQGWMKSLTDFTKDDVLSSIDLSETNNLLDVGGGDGTFAMSLLEKYPEKKFGVLERPESEIICKKNIESKGLNEKIQTFKGNFLEYVPEGFDAISMKHILHDWPSDACVNILNNCRKVLSNGNKLFIIDCVLNRNSPYFRWQITTDINMMTLFSARERTKIEFEELLNKTGFRLVKISDAKFDNVIEAVAI